MNVHNGLKEKLPSQILYDQHAKRFGLNQRNLAGSSLLSRLIPHMRYPTPLKSSSRHFKQPLDSTRSVIKHIRKLKREEMMTDDWAFLAMILDRIILWLYSLGIFFGSIAYYSIISNYKYPETDQKLLSFINRN